TCLDKVERLSSSCSTADMVNGIDAKKIRAQVHQGTTALAIVNHAAIQHPDAPVPAEGVEIRHGTEVDVGRVIPGVGQMGGHWQADPDHQKEAITPVTEIGKTDDAAFALPQHFFYQYVRSLHGLQGLGQNYSIKAAG